MPFVVVNETDHCTIALATLLAGITPYHVRRAILAGRIPTIRRQVRTTVRLGDLRNLDPSRASQRGPH